MNENMKIKYFDEELEVYDERRVVNKNTYSITLNYVPSPTRPLTVENGKTLLTETAGVPSSNQYVLDRENGLLLFNESMKGKVMVINYSAIGLWCISADKVYTNVDNKGEIIETLEDLMRENREIIESIKTIGDASSVITQLQADIDSALGLADNIMEGSSVNEELTKTITSSKEANTTLSDTISNADTKINEMNTWVNQHGDIVNLDNRVDTVEIKIPQINEQLADNTQSIKEVSEDARIFKPRVYAYLSQGSSGSVNWETYVDETTYREHLIAMKNAGCDGFTLCLQIQPSKEHRDNFDSGLIIEDDLIYRAYPSFENVQLLKRLGDDIGVPLVGIKFHNNWIRDNSKPLTFSKWFDQYTQEAYRFANEFTNIKYFSILNESKTIINTVSNKTKIKTLLDQLNKRGFVTGFSGVNDFDYDYDNYVNGIFIHTYPTISNKCQFTNYQDGIIGWESYGILETLIKMRKKYPDKTFVISETGVQNYWEALSLPEQNFNVDNTLIEDGSPSAIYFYGMFETLKNGDYDFLDSVWLFYTNPIREKTQKTIYKYTNGGVK